MRQLIRHVSGILLVVSLSITCWAQYKYPFQNPNLPVEERVTNILSLMTREEKVACLGTHPDVPRLGIQGTGHVEGLHGLAMGGPGGWGRPKVIPTTQFPQAIGLGETWDPDLIKQAAALEGLETRYMFQHYRQGGLVVRAPNADLARDPRWGRTEESYGEDPFLTGTLAVAFIRGLQGDHPKYWQTAALMKHFLANSNEDGRGSSSSNFDDRLWREYYSVPFRMGVVEGGSRAYMASYNAVNGIPDTIQPFLKNVTVKEWGQDGIICTDGGALKNLVTEHKYFPELDQAAAASVKAGINQFLDKQVEATNSALDKKLLTEAELDESLRGVFRVMIRLGQLDPPELVPYAAIKDGPDPWTTDKAKALARLVTQKSIVLLKNDNHALPLKKEALRSVAVIGPYADQVLLDWYSGTPPYTISALQGIRNKVGPEVTVTFAANNNQGAAVKLAKAADVAIVVVGNHPTCNAGWDVCPLPSEGKEAIDRKSITLEQEELVKEVYAANPRTIMVLIASFPYAINWSQEHVPAIVHMTHNSEELGNALADVLFGDVNPGGRLVHTWPASIDQLPPMMDYNIRHGRTYMYAKGQPLYPFGYGLSYTTFKYSKLKVSSDTLPQKGALTVRVDVKNTGDRVGEEVVQMYVQHVNSHVERPIKELKGFKRVTLNPGEEKTVELPLKADALAYWDDEANRFVTDADSVRILIGSSSADTKLERTVRVVE
jgi:beta-glucosidase